MTGMIDRFFGFEIFNFRFLGVGKVCLYFLDDLI